MNRFAADRRIGSLIHCVNIIIFAIARLDRWQMARHSTGPLLERLLVGDYDGLFAVDHEYLRRGLDGAPIAVADDRVALVVGLVPNLTGNDPIPVTAVLVARGNPERWLVAAIDFDSAVDIGFQRRVQHGSFSEEEDLAVIAAHEPLDREAVAIDWDDSAAVLREHEGGCYTVADALAELADFGRPEWPWMADECHMFAGLYLRAKHPELVRRYE